MLDLNPIGAGRAAVSPETDVRLEVVRRVASSPVLKESKRLRELFLFLCERALNEPGVAIHEQEVGTEVFGRSADYDTSEDTLVRVHASRLRKKLQQYFSSEGLHEPVIIEIPKGGYTPLFHIRDIALPEDKPLNGQGQPLLWKRRVKPLLAVLGVCAATLSYF